MFEYRALRAEVTHAILPGKSSNDRQQKGTANGPTQWVGREYLGARDNSLEGTRQNDPVTSGEGVLSSQRGSQPYEASVSPGIGFGPFLRSLGGGRRRPPSGGARAISEIPLGRARILTLCRDLRAKGRSRVDGLPKGNGGVQRFPRAGRRLALECKGRRELDCKTHPSSGGRKSRPTDALRPIILDNACILCITAAAGTELADAYSPDTVIASSPGKEVHDPWAFYLHAALLRQAFAHCPRFPTAAPRGSPGR
ncbi:hypothetical protein RJ641_000729, partial [Dillenia turbinata]